MNYLFYMMKTNKKDQQRDRKRRNSEARVSDKQGKYINSTYVGIIDVHVCYL